MSSGTEAFKNDLSQGQHIEREFAKRVLKWDVSSIQFSQGKFKDWDVMVQFTGKEPKTFEIKSDFMSSKTGNVGFEIRCNGKPSGIYASKADYIVYRLGNDFYYQNRGELLYRLDKVGKRTTEGGDGNRAEMYLVNNSHLSDLFKKL